MEVGNMAQQFVQKTEIDIINEQNEKKQKILSGEVRKKSQFQQQQQQQLQVTPQKLQVQSNPKNYNLLKSPQLRKPSSFFYQSIKEQQMLERQIQKSHNNMKKEELDRLEELDEYNEDIMANQNNQIINKHKYSNSLNNNKNLDLTEETENDTVIQRGILPEMNISKNKLSLEQKYNTKISDDSLSLTIYSDQQAYCDMIQNDSTYLSSFQKQFNNIFEKQLKKKLCQIPNMFGYTQNFKRSINIQQYNGTIIFNLDDCLVKTSMYKEDLPQVNSSFKYNNLDIYVYYRRNLLYLLSYLSGCFELIVWSSNIKEFTDLLVASIDQQNQYFSHVLSLEQCQKSEDKSISAKNLEILLSNRSIEKIIIVDNLMDSYMLQLTNGIYLPPLRMNNDVQDDQLLSMLASYLKTFVNCNDFRQKIRRDFQLDSFFNDSKSNMIVQRFKKNITNSEQSNTNDTNEPFLRDSQPINK